MIHEIIQIGDVVGKKIPFTNNLVDSFTKTLIRNVFDGHRDSIGVKCIPNIL